MHPTTLRHIVCSTSWSGDGQNQVTTSIKTQLNSIDIQIKDSAQLQMLSTVVQVWRFASFPTLSLSDDTVHISARIWLSCPLKMFLGCFCLWLRFAAWAIMWDHKVFYSLIRWVLMVSFKCNKLYLWNKHRMSGFVRHGEAWRKHTWL